MSFAITLLVVLFLVFLGVLPLWPFSRDWGMGPAILIGIVLVILLGMTMWGHVPGLR